MKQLAAFCFFLTLNLSFSKACSCFRSPSFCEMVNADGNVGFDWSILHVRVLETFEDSVRVKALQVFRGEDVTGHVFVIFDGNPFWCGTTTDNLEKGGEYIFALALGSPAPLQLPGCDNPYLSVKYGKVKGEIAPGVTSISLDKFADLPACGELQPVLPRQWTLMPTLLGNELTFTPVDWKYEADVALRIFDAAGRLVHAENRVGFSGFTSIEINTSAWGSGIYFCQVAVLGRRQTVKIVKSN